MNEKPIQVPVWLATIFVGVAFSGLVSLHVYTITEISSLKQDVAGLSAKVEFLAGSQTKHLARNE